MFKKKAVSNNIPHIFRSKLFSCTTNIYGARGCLSEKKNSRAEFCNLLAKNRMPFPQKKKIVIKIEERKAPCKMIYVSHIFF
jgi:hypothetical protein